MSNIVKKDVFGPQTGLTLNKGKLKSPSSPFQARVNQARAEQPDASAMPHRLCLMLDRSSSMHGDKMDLLKQAIDNFVIRCDFQNTSIAIETFPASLELSLTSVSFMITSSVASLTASGNTPMRSCVQGSLEKIPMTRGIIVSDGEATDWRGDFYEDFEEAVEKNKQDDLLAKYKKASIPIDCVHIGNSSSGEELLRRIARETGG